jgi:hypothetical protein
MKYVAKLSSELNATIDSRMPEVWIPYRYHSNLLIFICFYCTCDIHNFIQTLRQVHEVITCSLNKINFAQHI